MGHFLFGGNNVFPSLSFGGVESTSLVAECEMRGSAFNIVFCFNFPVAGGDDFFGGEKGAVIWSGEGGEIHLKKRCLFLICTPTERERGGGKQ